MFPSTTDTLGLVLLEAMASGLPVVAARTPAAEDLLARVPAGGLFDLGDPATLTEAVDRWLAHSADRNQLAAAAQERIMTWRRSTEELQEYYERAVVLARTGVAA